MFFKLRLAGWLLLLAGAAGACTVAAFGPGSTRDGRPMLWKNRDVTNPNQEFRFFAGGRFRFVANAYAGETTHVWAGINEAGFAIMNADADNIGGFDLPGDDGQLMFNALGGCGSVDDFIALLDSSGEVGREWTANYGVFDSTGRTAMFEVANTWYVGYEAAEDTLGFIVRANFAFAGDTNRRIGLHRFNRAFSLCTTARRGNRIDAEFVITELARDIAQPDLDPYPLPFEGFYEGYPYGCLPTANSLCRNTTRSVEVMVGPRPGEPAGTGMMWALAGGPEVTVPIPLWVAAGRTPGLLDGDSTSALCDSAIALRQANFPYEEWPRLVNTFSYVRVREALAPTESLVFALVQAETANWSPAGPTPEQAGALSDSCCALLLDGYRRLGEQSGPPSRPQGIRPTVVENVLLLRFPAGTGRGQVFDAAGRRVATVNGVPGGELHWDVRELVPGGYVVRFPDRPEAAPVRFVRANRP